MAARRYGLRIAWVSTRSTGRPSACRKASRKSKYQLRVAGALPRSNSTRKSASLESGSKSPPEPPSRILRAGPHGSACRVQPVLLACQRSQRAWPSLPFRPPTALILDAPQQRLGVVRFRQNSFRVVLVHVSSTRSLSVEAVATRLDIDGAPPPRMTPFLANHVSVQHHQAAQLTR